MSNSVIITLIICITVIIVVISQCIYQFILERDNYSSHRAEFEIETLKNRLKYIERKIFHENS